MTVPTHALVYGLTAWINGTGLVAPVWPEISLEVNATHTLGIAKDIRRCYALVGMEPPTIEEAYAYAEGLNGMYCEDRVTIDSNDVDLSTPAGQTVLVHELVHWLQDHNGDAQAAECVPALERDAYRVHHEWQRQMGLPVYPDEFTVLMRSQCGDRVE